MTEERHRQAEEEAASLCMTTQIHVELNKQTKKGKGKIDLCTLPNKMEDQSLVKPSTSEEYDLLANLKELQLEISLGQLLSLVPKYHRQLLWDLEGEEEELPAPQACSVEVMQDWDVVVPELTIGVEGMQIGGTMIDGGLGVNIMADET